MKMLKFIVDSDQMLDTTAALDAGKAVIEATLGVPVLRTEAVEVSESDYWTAEGRDADTALQEDWLRKDGSLWRIKARTTFQNSGRPDEVTVVDSATGDERTLTVHELKAAFRPAPVSAD